MTTLGLIFAIAYLVGLVGYRRVGLLTVTAAAIPFNDSAAILVSDIPISPFYFGALLYLAITMLGDGLPKSDALLPLALLTWSAGITVLGPTLFASMPVVASGIGLDQQADRLTALSYSTSNVAQVAYLGINLLLLLTLSSTPDARDWIPLVPAVFGTSVATAAWILTWLDLPWPEELFHNNTTNAYAYVKTARLTAQFSEPSHLGVFALTSAVLIVAMLVSRRFTPAVTAALLVVAVADILLVVESTSGTALAGAAIFAAVAVIWAIYRAIASGARASSQAIILTIFTLGVSLAFLPRIVALAQGVIQYKIDSGTSIDSRTAADATGLDVFLNSWTLGVGLGSNRASSLFVMLLSTVGIVGTILFLMIMGRAIRNGLLDRYRRPFAAALACLIISSFFSFADLVSPMMWLLAGYCWAKPRKATTVPFTDLHPRRPLRAYGE